MRVIEVPAVFGRGLNPTLPINTAGVQSLRDYKSLCVFVFVCVSCPECECPFVGRECVCHSVPLILAECPTYD